MSDAKELMLIARQAERMRSARFDESDVYMFIILLRSHARPGSALRELGDFVAHRVRDRGMFLAFLQDKGRKMEGFKKTPHGERMADYLLDKALSVDPVFTHQELTNDINCALRGCGIKELPQSVAVEQLICVMSLLQCVTLKKGDGEKIGRLVLWITKNQVGLIGIVKLCDDSEAAIPLLVCDNKFCDVEISDDRQVGITPNVAAALVRQNDRLRLVSR